MTVRGVFYPAVLMTPGLWERSDAGEGGPEIQWRTPLQNWLFSGFERWAPSWNLNTSLDDSTDRPSFAQVGHEDEAFSLLVVVMGPGSRRRFPRAAQRRRDGLQRRDRPPSCISRGHLRDAMPTRNANLGKKLRHDPLARRSVEGTTTYDQANRCRRSVTLGASLGVRGAEGVAARGGGAGNRGLVFFVWEHTRFFESGPRASMGSKRSPISNARATSSEHFGEPELIQKVWSGSVPGRSRRSRTASFYSVPRARARGSRASVQAFGADGSRRSGLMDAQDFAASLLPARRPPPTRCHRQAVQLTWSTPGGRRPPRGQPGPGPFVAVAEGSVVGFLLGDETFEIAR